MSERLKKDNLFSGKIQKIPVGSNITVSNVKKIALFKKTSDELEVWQATKRTEIAISDTDADDVFDAEYTIFREV